MLRFSDWLLISCLLLSSFITMFISLGVLVFDMGAKNTTQVSLLSQKSSQELVVRKRDTLLLASRGMDERRKELAKPMEEERKAMAAKAEEDRKTQNRKLEETDVYLLARMIVAEAEDQPYLGKIAVGSVIINRTKCGEFPKTIRGVIFQNHQFSPIANGRFYKVQITAEDIQAAREALRGKDPTHGSLYFYDPRLVHGGWICSLRVNVRIGNHNFAS